MFPPDSDRGEPRPALANTDAESSQGARVLRGPQHGDTRTLARARLLSPTAAPSVTNGVALPRTCFDTPPHTCLLTHTTSRALLHARSHAHRCSLSRTRSDTRSHTHHLSLLTPAPRPASPTHALSRSLAHTDTRSLTLAASLTRTLPGGRGPGGRGRGSGRGARAPSGAQPFAPGGGGGARAPSPRRARARRGGGRRGGAREEERERVLQPRRRRAPRRAQSGRDGGGCGAGGGSGGTAGSRSPSANRQLARPSS